MIFDTHTHLNVEEFAGREAEEITLAAEMGVTQMNIVGLINRRLSVLWSWWMSTTNSTRPLVGIRQKRGLTRRRLKPTCLISSSIQR